MVSTHHFSEIVWKVGKKGIFTLVKTLLLKKICLYQLRIMHDLLKIGKNIHRFNCSINHPSWTLNFESFLCVWKFLNHHSQLWTKKMEILKATSNLFANGNPKKIQNIGINCQIIQTIGIMD